MRLLPLEVELSGSARRPLTALGVASAIWLASRPGVAAESVRLDYRAPVECPDAPVFIERVRTRVPSARMAEAGELAREVSIVVALDEEGYMARLDFVDVRGETITRTLAGNTCDEVVSGIALVTALALEAQHEPAPGGTLPASEPTESTAPGAGQRPESPAAAPLPEAAELEAAPKSPPRARRARVRRRGFRHGAGVGGGNAWYVAPGTPAVFDAVFRVAHTSFAGSARAGFRSWIGTATIGGRSANFLGYAGSVEGCPISWPRSGRVRFEPCFGATLGVLEGEGDRTQQLQVTDSARIFWADVRGIARLRLAITKLVELEGQGEVGVPLRTHRFMFQNPEETVFEVPRAGLGWRAGVMLHFP
jgi:hypothetical protein